MPTTTFLASADAYVFEDSPSTNYGSNQLLNVSRLTPGGPYYSIDTYMNWDLSAVPAGSVVADAYIDLYIAGISAGGAPSVILSSADGSWSESSITWANRPSVGAAGNLAGTPSNAFQATSAGQTVRFSGLASLVQSWVSGTRARNGVALYSRTNASGSTEFSSREGGAFGPRLTVVYNAPPGTPGAPSVTPTPVNTTGTISWSAASDPDGDALTYDVELSTNNGASYSVIAAGVSGTSTAYNFVSQPSTSVAFLRVRAKDTSGVYGPYATGSAFTIQHNVAPNAPGSLAPAGNQTVERTQQQRLSWVFSDPDGGDSQSKFDVQYRLGAGAWTVVTQTTNATYYDAPANTFPAGSIEWQVRTYDAQGLVSPYSSSAFFTAAVTPGLPIITSPANNSTISTSASVVTWSAPSQEAFQVQTASDAAGTVVYTDSGEIISTTARDRGLVFGTNNRTEVIRLRIKNSGLWSGWSTATVNVSFTAPEVPSVALVPSSSSGSITVGVTAPKGNLLTTNQASLETTSAGWVNGGNATVARSTAQAMDGTASLSLTSLAAGNMATSTSPGPAVTAGQVYTAVASFRAATVGRAVFVRIDWFTAAVGLISSVTGALSADTTTGWQQATVTAQAPANAAFGGVVLTVAATGAASEVHYVDAVGLYETPTGNLVPGGGDFENGTAGWASPGTYTSTATFAQSTARAYTGRSSLLITPTATVGSGTSADFAGTAGQTYTGSVWVFSTTAVTLQMGLSRNNGTDAAFTSLAVPANTWTRMAATTTLTTSGTASIFVRSTTTTVQAFYLDAVQVVVGSTAVDYLPPTTSNLVTNPSFEVDTAGWTPSGLTITRDTTYAFSGAASARLVATASGHIAFTNVTTLVGEVYTVSLRMRGTAADIWTAIMRDSTGAVIGGSANVTLDPGGWAVLTYTGVATTTTTRFGVRASGASTAYLDAVQVEAGSVATPYVDGSLGAGYFWTGAANASTSTRQFPWTIPTPAITGVDVYRRLTAEGGDGIRIATGVSLFGGYTDYTPASLTSYDYKARVIGANGTTADSPWAT